jgi:uncharacterized protein YndB with AHSA1/START domain
MSTLARLAGLPALALACLLAPSPLSQGSAVRAISFEREVEVPLTPEDAFDAFTGDVSPWWDHSFSKDPARFEIEPEPGGGFWEIFDERGDGVLHARVTWAQRGERLVLRGPLGLHGRAVDLVFDLRFEASGDGARVRVKADGVGAFGEGEEDVIASVWAHFLGRYAAYVKGELDR